MNVQGNVRAIKFIGDGSLLTNLPITTIVDTAISNWVNDSNFVPVPPVDLQHDVGTSTMRFRNVYTSNLIGLGTIYSERFHGKADSLNFENITTSIVPSQSFIDLSLGTQARPFASVHSRNIYASEEVRAFRFVGDGSMLTGIRAISESTTNFTNLNTNIIPAFDDVYTIGQPHMRYKTVFTNHLNALGIVTGSRLIITQNGAFLNVANSGSTSNGTGISFSIAEEIRLKLGDQVDATLNNMIINLLVAGELIGDGTNVYNVCSLGPVRSNIVPHSSSAIDLGSSNLPFRKLYVDSINTQFTEFQNLEIQEDLTVNNNVIVGDNVEVGRSLFVEGDILCSRSITASNLIGNGSMIYGVNELGPLTANVIPYQELSISIGTPHLPFKEVHTDTLYTARLHASDLYFNGERITSLKNEKGSKICYCIPKETVYVRSGNLLYKSHNVNFFNVDMRTGEFKSKSNGLYNIAFFSWRTNRSFNDMDVLWKIVHSTSYNLGVMEYQMKGTDNRHIFMREGDLLNIVVENAKYSDGFYASPMTVFSAGALVLTQLGTTEDFHLP